MTYLLIYCKVSNVNNAGDFHLKLEENFPIVPPGWYYVCHISQLRSAPIVHKVHKSEYLLWKDEDNIYVSDARCPHMNADLSKGKISKSSITCPYHGFKFDKGICVHTPNSEDVPSWANIKTYPVKNICGHIFFFNNTEALFDFPFFINEFIEEFTASSSFSFEGEINWYTLASHAFDLNHFRSVHERELLSDITINSKMPYQRANTYTAKVIGTSLREKLIQLVAGKEINMTIDTYGANLFLLNGKFSNGVTSYFILNSTPLDDNNCKLSGIVFSKKTNKIKSLFQPLIMAVRRHFTYKYLEEEARTLHGTHFNLGTTYTEDTPIIEYFKWLQGHEGFKIKQSKDNS